MSQLWAGAGGGQSGDMFFSLGRPRGAVTCVFLAGPAGQRPGNAVTCFFYGLRPACGGRLGLAYREIPIGPAQPASGQPARICDIFFSRAGRAEAAPCFFRGNLKNEGAAQGLFARQKKTRRGLWPPAALAQSRDLFYFFGEKSRRLDFSRRPLSPVQGGS